MNLEFLWTNLKFSFGENAIVFVVVVIFGLTRNYLTIFIPFATTDPKATWFSSIQRKSKFYASEGSK